jgi:hypothetical protein
MHISSLIGESKKNKKHQSSREENKEEVEGFVEKKIHEILKKKKKTIQCAIKFAVITYK